MNKTVLFSEVTQVGEAEIYIFGLNILMLSSILGSVYKPSNSVCQIDRYFQMLQWS